MRTLGVVVLGMGIIYAARLSSLWYTLVVGVLIWLLYGWGWWNGHQDGIEEMTSGDSFTIHWHS